MILHDLGAVKASSPLAQTPPGRQHPEHLQNITKEEARVIRMAKQFLTVDHITLWFPLGLSDDDTQPHGTELAQSTTQLETSELLFSPPNVGQDSIFQEMPGSFSNYAHSTISRRQGSIGIREPGVKRSTIKLAPVDLKPQPKKDASATISVQVGSVISHVDFSTGRIMFQILDRVVKAMSGNSQRDNKRADTSDTAAASGRVSIDLSLRNFTLAWVERLATESVLDFGAPRPYLDPNPLDAILRMDLSTIKFTGQLKAEEARSKLLIGKYSFSSLDHDIISFLSPRPRSRRSASGSSDQLHNDVEIDF